MEVLFRSRHAGQKCFGKKKTAEKKRKKRVEKSYYKLK
jgi:hypothetical protein